MRHIPRDHPDAERARPLREQLRDGRLALPLSLGTQLAAAVCAALGERADDPELAQAVHVAITRVLLEAEQ